MADVIESMSPGGGRGPSGDVWAQYNSVRSAMDTDINARVERELAESGPADNDPLDEDVDQEGYYDEKLRRVSGVYKTCDVQLAKEKFVSFVQEMESTVKKMAAAGVVTGADLRRITLMAEMNALQVALMLKGAMNRTLPSLERAKSLLASVSEGSATESSVASFMIGFSTEVRKELADLNFADAAVENGVGQIEISRVESTAAAANDDVDDLAPPMPMDFEQELHEGEPENEDDADEDVITLD